MVLNQKPVNIVILHVDVALKMLHNVLVVKKVTSSMELTVLPLVQMVNTKIMLLKNVKLVTQVV
jgi:hypothetical protein